ncbi:PD-(D/E)XK nuclease family protein [Flavobacterium sp. '19STA2R22 D10 B1']|uniref:PD-(D/E)XK nuclease family protein n=1 Tax=Flavobacterium aerium TaxID=3037261 RepID=UPI00278C6388|nr:PD-(D/E)XK nuclease family protein [Flavobacterium sp. '19STA2R22 D10 B1']
MTNTSFLDKLSTELIDKYEGDLSNIVIVLPNKRAKIFLIDAIKSKITKTIIAPKIINIEEFIQDIAGVRSIESIELLFEFYEVYSNDTAKEKQQSFEQFSNWAKTLLQDFNEIDRYLLDPLHVLSYLKDIEDIKHWSLDPEKRTQLIENYLEFWKLLPDYYNALYDHLLQKGIGYQGLIYREAVGNLDHFSNSLQKEIFVFAGFNALNAAEERIIQHLLATSQAAVYWDIDTVFIEDKFHDAGYFIRNFKENWKYYKTNPFQWIANDFSQNKNIQIIGTPKTVGQAKITGNLIEQILDQSANSSLQNVAVVLGEENLLIPLLYSLPAGVNSLNITMGYAGKNNPAQILIHKLFKLHANAKARNDKSYVFYYKDVLDIVTHPLIEPYVNASNLVNIINTNNFTFITHQKLVELYSGENLFFEILFNKWDNDPAVVLDRLSTILLMIKERLTNDSEDEKITKAFVYSIFKVINKLINFFSKYNHINNIDTLFAIYKQVVDLAEVSFEGEPLTGLQIMGVLESRVLDFETVIITSVNEGKFPAGKSQNSFIPYDVKKELGLPTYKEKDAIYTYHFYHLLQRAKNIYLLYNTESEGLDAGERSRFITQLEVEKQENHSVVNDVYNAVVPSKAYEPIVVLKSESVMVRLKEIAEVGFSPSSLTSYIRNPIQFYFQKIVRIREVEKVEENIAVNTLGTIIHETLRALYEPYVDLFLSLEAIAEMSKKVDDEVLNQFKEVYKHGEIKKGRNLLAFEVAKRNIQNFLNKEKELIQAGDAVKILALETTFERTLHHPKLPYSVNIKGNVDRIEQRNGKVRIIDYKTGKVEGRDVMVKTWDNLCVDIKNDKIIQVLAYAFMYEPLLKEGQEMEVGILSFKNLRSGFLPFRIAENKEEVTVITPDVLEKYIEQLVVLLNEILDQKIPFEEKVN